MTAPERKATCRPRFRLSLAPCAVRDDAAVAVFMPRKPQRPEKNPPVRKATGTNGFCTPINASAAKTATRITKTRPTRLYCWRR